MLSSSSALFLHFFLSSSSSLFLPSFLLQSAAGGEPRPAQTPPRERGGGHHARGRAGSRRLPPQRPARALPRPGLHAPISEEPLGGMGGGSAERRLGRGSKGRSFAAVTEADGDGRRAKVLLLWSGERVVLWSWRLSLQAGYRGQDQAVSQWVADHVRLERRYHPPGGSGLRRRLLRRVRKSIAQRYY